MATGLPLPHRPVLRIAPGKQFRVWYVNGEDPIEETERRFQAAMLHFGIKPEDVEGRLFIDSGHDQDFVFARENGKVVTVVEPVVDSVIAGIKKNGIDCLILDPVVSFHAVAENDNTKLQQVLEQFSAVANETTASVELVAHTRKANGNEITADDARGASALHDKVRSLRTVNRMTEKEGEKAGLSAGEFKSVFRLDNGKASMTKASAGSMWRRLVSVKIESGDDVGVCEAWHWPSAEELRLDWLRSPSRPGIRTCAAKVYDNPMERRAPRVRLLDPARDNGSTLRRPEVVVHLPSDRRTGSETLPARRRIHFRITPGLPARIPLPTRTCP
jgi:AAA domain